MPIKTRDIETLSKTDNARFWSKVDVGRDGDCWKWRGGVDKDGYGKFKLNGSNHRAHKISFFVFNGEIEPGFLILHKCDEPGCVNPSHLWQGTPKENTQDALSKGRMATGERNGAYTHPKKIKYGDDHWSRKKPHLVAHGENCGAAKLTEQQVREIRSKYIPRKYSQGRLGREYGVDKALIRMIVKRRIWKHVT